MVRVFLPVCLFVSVIFCQLDAKRQVDFPRLCKEKSALDGYDESFFSIFESAGSNRDKPSLPRMSTTERITHGFGSTGCPGLKQNPTTVCPHYSVFNYDPNRLPVLVVEARCSCKQCLDNTKMPTDNACKPMFYHRHVLQRDDKDSCYYRKIKAFSVGCQCLLSR